MDPTNTDESPLLYTGEGGQLQPNLSEEEQQQEEQVPPVSTYCHRLRYWLKQLRYPILVGLGNLLLLGLSSALVRNSLYDLYRFKYSWSVDASDKISNQEGGGQQLKLLPSLGIAIAVLTFLVDSYICLKSARKLEGRVTEWQEINQDEGIQRASGPVTESNTSEISPSGTVDSSSEAVDFVKMSQSIDDAFSCSSDSSSSTFFVCLLYVLFSISAWMVLHSIESLIQLQLAPLAKLPDTMECLVRGPFNRDYQSSNMYGVASLQQSPQFQDLPLDVQDWIKAHDKGGNSPAVTQTEPYLHDSDGSLVFTFTKRRPDEEGKSYGRWANEPGLAVYSSGNETIVEYLQVESDGDDQFSRSQAMIQLVGFPKYPPFFAWCAVFEIALSKNIQDEMICHNSNSTSVRRFPPVKDTGPSYGGSGSSMDNSMYATDDTLWVAVKREVNREQVSSVSTVIITLIVLDVMTLEKKVAAELTMTRNEVGGGGPGETRILNPNCRIEYYVSSWISILTLSLLFFYLYRLDVPSCVVPACLAVTTLINFLVLSRNTTAMITLILGCICLSYLVVIKNGNGSTFKFVSVQMAVWALYSLLLCSSLAFLSQLTPNMRYMFFYDVSPGELLLFPFLSFVVAVLISVLLNHPIFEILAASISVVACLSCLSVFAGVRYLLVSVVLFTFSLGCFRVGGCLQQYRVNELVYSRRIWRCLCSWCNSRRQAVSTSN